MQKYAKLNFLLSIVMLFTIVYQSLHIFLDFKYHNCEHNVKSISEISKIKIVEKENCPVCSFEFAAFLSTEIFTFVSISYQPKFQFIDNYKSIVQEKEFLFFSHRGPPFNLW